MTTEVETLVLNVAGNAQSKLRDVDGAFRKMTAVVKANDTAVAGHKQEMNEFTSSLISNFVALGNAQSKLRDADGAFRKVTATVKANDTAVAGHKQEMSEFTSSLISNFVAFDALKGFVLGAAGALTTFAKEGMQAAVAGSVEATDAADNLTLAMEDLKLALGDALLGSDVGTDQMTEMGAAIAKLEGMVRSNAEKIGEAFDKVIKVVKVVAAVLISTASFALLPLAGLIDIITLAVTGTIKAFLGLRAAVLGLATGVAELLHQLGELETDGLKLIREQAREAVEDFEDFEVQAAGLTEGLWELNKATWGAATSQDKHNTSIRTGEKLLAEMNAELQKQLVLDAQINNLSAIELDRLRLIGEATRKLTEANEARRKDFSGEVDEAKKKSGKDLTEERKRQAAKARERFAKNLDAVLANVATARRLREEKEAESVKARWEEYRRDQELQVALNRRVEEERRAELRKSKALWDSFGDSLFSQVGPAIDSVALSLSTMFVQMGRGRQTLAEFGDNVLNMVSGLVAQLAPAFTQLGIALFATETGNALGLIAAGLALSTIAGSLAAFGDSNPAAKSKGSGASQLRDVAREFARDREVKAEERTIVLQIGTREFFRTIADGRRRGQIGGNA